MSKLTTHVLDTSAGIPAVGMIVELRRLEPKTDLVQSFTTNTDGRVDGPLLQGDAFKKGLYELQFFVADYFRLHDVSIPDPAFFDVVPIRFGIADSNSNYHVPLLVSPFGYSTYRGS